MICRHRLCSVSAMLAGVGLFYCKFMIIRTDIAPDIRFERI